MKYVANGKEVTKEEFESLVGEQFKWFQNDTVNATSVSNLFRGKFVSEKQINDHIKGVLDKDDVINSVNRGEKEMMESFHNLYDNPNYFKFKKCSAQCYCDGSCKKEIKEPFSIQVPKPTTLNQTQFYYPPTPEETLEQFKEALRKLEDKKEMQQKSKNNEGVKETEGKLNYELDWDFIQQMAERMSQNKGKYEPYNWAKPMDVEKLKQSLFRHVIEVMKGNYSDDGRDFGHWESVALNAMMINYQLKNNL
jgi:hypothetical protein